MKKISANILYALLLLPFSLTAFGQVVTAPSSVTGEGNQFSVFYPFANSGFGGSTTQIVLEPGELNLTAGQQITAIAFRLDGGGSGTAPSSDATFSNFTITLGQAAAGLATDSSGMDTTFANNFASG